MYNNNAYAQTDNSGSGSTDNSGSSGTTSTDNSGGGGGGSTDNSGGSNTNTPSTDNTQPTKQSSTNQPKQADTCDAGCHGFRTTVGQGLCGIVAPLPLKPLCGAIALNAQVQTPHHHHHN